MEDPLKRLIDERLACVVEPLNKGNYSAPSKGVLL